MRIGEAIRLIRKSKGIKQKELAKLVGIATNSMSNIEKCIHEPTIATLFTVANALVVKVEQIYLQTLADVELHANQEEFNKLHARLIELLC
jgi:transcriptional regulator with XRE-family HTH domain